LPAAFAFATAGFFALALLSAASIAAPAAIRTAGQSSRPNNPIARNPALVLNNLTPKATPTLHRPTQLRMKPHTTTLSRPNRPVCPARRREPPQTLAPIHIRRPNCPAHRRGLHSL
jgi:hypothetical protein